MKNILLPSNLVTAHLRPIHTAQDNHSLLDNIDFCSFLMWKSSENSIWLNIQMRHSLKYFLVFVKVKKIINKKAYLTWLLNLIHM